MVINNGNIHEVNNISLHDACFESFVFDRVHNRLETVVKPEWPFVIPPDFDSSESFEYAELKRIRITCVDEEHGKEAITEYQIITNSEKHPHPCNSEEPVIKLENFA